MSPRHLFALASLVSLGCAPPPELTFTPDGSSWAKPPPVLSGPRLTLPRIEQTTLGNGLTVYASSRPSSSLTRVIFADRAAIDEGGPQAGLAVLTSTALEYNFRSASDPHVHGPAVLGHSFRGGADADGTFFSYTVAPESTREACATLGRFVASGALEDWAIGQARSMLDEHRDDERGDNFTLIDRLAARELFGPTNPFAESRFGTKEGIEKITDDEVRRFHDVRYHPTQSVLVLVGPAPIADYFAIAKESFESWRPTTKLEAPATAAWAAMEGTLRSAIVGLAAQRASATVTAVLPASARGAPDSLACELTASLLEASDSPLLVHQRRATDSGYYTGAKCQSSRAGGMLELELDTAPEQLATTLEAIEAAVVHSHTPASAEQVETARALYLGDVARITATNSGLASVLAAQFCAGLPLSDLSTLEARIQAITATDLTRFAQRYLDPANMVIAVQGKRPELEATLARFGKTRWEDQ